MFRDKATFCERGAGGFSQSMLRYIEICKNWVSKVAKYQGCRGRTRQMRYRMEPLVPDVQWSGVRLLFLRTGLGGKGGSLKVCSGTLKYAKIQLSKVAKYRGCLSHATHMRFRGKATFFAKGGGEVREGFSQSMLRYTEICENWVSKVAKYRGCRGRARQMRYRMEALVPAIQCSGVRPLFCEGGRGVLSKYAQVH